MPNSSSSYFSGSKRAPFKTINGFSDLVEFLWIFLATNSLPDPVGPLIKILLSDPDNFWINWLILVIDELIPIKSYQEKK